MWFILEYSTNLVIEKVLWRKVATALLVVEYEKQFAQNKVTISIRLHSHQFV